MARTDATQPDRPAGEHLVIVFAAPNATEGQLAKGLLEANGIPVLVKGEGDGPYRLGPAYLWVPVGLEVQARLLLAEAGASDGGDDDPDEAAEGPAVWPGR